MIWTKVAALGEHGRFEAGAQVCVPLAQILRESLHLGDPLLLP